MDDMLTKFVIYSLVGVIVAMDMFGIIELVKLAVTGIRKVIGFIKKKTAGIS